MNLNAEQINRTFQMGAIRKIMSSGPWIVTLFDESDHIFRIECRDFDSFKLKHERQLELTDYSASVFCMNNRLYLGLESQAYLVLSIPDLTELARFPVPKGQQLFPLWEEQLTPESEKANRILVGISKDLRLVRWPEAGKAPQISEKPISASGGLYPYEKGGVPIFAVYDRPDPTNTMKLFRVDGQFLAGFPGVDNLTTIVSSPDGNNLLLLFQQEENSILLRFDITSKSVVFRTVLDIPVERSMREPTSPLGWEGGPVIFRSAGMIIEKYDATTGKRLSPIIDMAADAILVGKNDLLLFNFGNDSIRRVNHETGTPIQVYYSKAVPYGPIIPISSSQCIVLGGKGFIELEVPSLAGNQMGDEPPPSYSPVYIDADIVALSAGPTVQVRNALDLSVRWTKRCFPKPIDNFSEHRSILVVHPDSSDRILWVYCPENASFMCARDLDSGELLGTYTLRGFAPPRNTPIGMFYRHFLSFPTGILDLHKLGKTLRAGAATDLFYQYQLTEVRADTLAGQEFPELMRLHDPAGKSSSTNEEEDRISIEVAGRFAFKLQGKTITVIDLRTGSSQILPFPTSTDAGAKWQEETQPEMIKIHRIKVTNNVLAAAIPEHLILWRFRDDCPLATAIDAPILFDSYYGFNDWTAIGDLLVVDRPNSNLEAWNYRTKQQILKTDIRGGDRATLHITPDRVYVGFHDSLRIFGIPEGREKFQIGFHELSIGDNLCILHKSSSGPKEDLYCGIHNRRTFQIWEVQTGRRIVEKEMPGKNEVTPEKIKPLIAEAIPGIPESAWTLEFFQQGNYADTALYQSETVEFQSKMDCSIHYRDVLENREKGTFLGHGASISHLWANQDFLVSSTLGNSPRDQPVNLWDIRSGEIVSLLQVGHWPGMAAIIGAYVVVIDEKLGIRVFPAPSRAESTTFDMYTRIQNLPTLARINHLVKSLPVPEREQVLAVFKDLMEIIGFLSEKVYPKKR